MWFYMQWSIMAMGSSVGFEPRFPMECLGLDVFSDSSN